MLSYFRFYYFVFLSYLKNRQGNILIIPAWRIALALITISVIPLIFLLYNLLINYLFYAQKKLIIHSYISKWIYVFICILFYEAFYKVLRRNDKWDKIYNEFIGHPLNTKRNRIICWIILLLIFIVPLVSHLK